MTVMTPADRKAAERYAAALEAQFKDNQTLLWTARDLGDTDGYKACSDISRTLYREIQEVRVALKTNTLVF